MMTSKNKYIKQVVDGFQNKNSPCYYSNSMYVKMYDAIYSMQICSNTKTTTNCYSI